MDGETVNTDDDPQVCRLAVFPPSRGALFHVSNAMLRRTQTICIGLFIRSSSPALNAATEKQLHATQAAGKARGQAK